MTGQTMVIFRAEASYMESMDLRNMAEFKAKDYFYPWPPEIDN